jgi:hypothetical protein
MRFSQGQQRADNSASLSRVHEAYLVRYIDLDESPISLRSQSAPASGVRQDQLMYYTQASIRDWNDGQFSDRLTTGEPIGDVIRAGQEGHARICRSLRGTSLLSATAA